MDEQKQPTPRQGTDAEAISGPAESDPADRPLFASADDDDAATRIAEESRADLAIRGAAATGALGGNAGLAAGALTGFGAAIGVNTEAGEPVEVDDEETDH